MMEDRNIEVEEENWEALVVFLALGSQWRKEYAGLDGRLVYHGLDYPAVDVVIKMNGHRGEKARSIFHDIQIMEATALPILNKVK